MKILFVTEYYVPHIGGREIVFKNLAEKLVKKGHECSVITCRLQNTKDYEEINKVKIYRVNVPLKGDMYWFTFFSLPKIWELSKDADIIHTTTYSGAFPAFFVSKLQRIPCIITVHEIFGNMWKNLTGINWFSAKMYQFLEKMTIHLPFDRYCCISFYTRNCLRLLGVEDRKLKTIYVGVDYQLFNSKKADGIKIRKKLKLRDQFIYMYYGRPGISKGVEYLIKAAYIISKRIKESKLLLILTNYPKRRYKYILNLIDTLNLRNRIILLNPVPIEELPDYISCADCIVVPSLSEGFGFVAAEVCAMDIPIVSTDIGSLPEVVSGKYILVEPRNPKAIAEGVERIHKGKVEDKGKKIFSWNTSIEEYIEVYSEVLKR